MDDAIADFTKAIELDPQDPEAYSNRGKAKKAKGDLAGADEDFAQADELKRGCKVSQLDTKKLTEKYAAKDLSPFVVVKVDTCNHEGDKCDTVLFLKLTRNCTNEEAAKATFSIKEELAADKIDGVAFVETTENFRIGSSEEGQTQGKRKNNRTNKNS